MIPKLFNAGKSFKSLGAYLLHDPNRAETSERIKWTHTLNLAADHPTLAIDEMLWTYRSADALKREAGAATGGRRLQAPVKHFSLNWHPSESPTQVQMIEAVQSFLTHMKWQEHQALIVCHDDKHPHVHVMVNAVHPDTGKVLEGSFERRRAQEWAKAYEREHQLIFCEERMKPVADRAKSPTREAWQKLRQSEAQHDRTELARLESTPDYFARGDDKHVFGQEWTMLKDFQRKQREQFFVDGKQAFKEARNQAFRDVRDEFRGQWSAYYAAARGGQAKAMLAETKLAIKEAQAKALDERRIRACDELRKQRDGSYDLILEQQRFDRAELGKRQDQGLRTYALMDLAHLVPERAEDGRDFETKAADRKTRHPTDRTQAGFEFGRTIRNTTDPDLSREERAPHQKSRQQEDTAQRPEPVRERMRSESGERTETVVERERNEKAREMTDQSAGRDQDDAVRALRASWNKTRRYRSRRD